MKRINYILLYTLFLFLPFVALTACSDDDKVEENIEIPITVDPNSTLYGIIIDENGNGIKNVAVSDGFQVVLTDDKGVYQMVKNENADFVFYSTPAEYEIAVSYTNYPDFFAKIDKDQEKFRKDFKLKRLAAVENDFTLICIGDPQCNTKDLRRFRQETMNDIAATVQASSLPVYGLTLGDVVSDEPGIFRHMKSNISSAGIPIFHTPGNHDKVANNGTKPRDAKAYQEYFGPLNYSFNRGNVHFISMDNVIFTNSTSYKGGFSDEQVEWLKQDLANVPKDKMIIFQYHIPIRNGSSDNRGAVLDLLKDYAEVHLMVGHTHYNENYIHSASRNYMYEHIHAATCGSWWHSNINGDGAPVGYAVYEIKGSKMANWYYKPVLSDKNDQIRIHKGLTVDGGKFEEFAYDNTLASGINVTANTIFANVWNADKNWTIRLYEDGVDKGEMTLMKTVNDPWSVGYHIGVVGRGTPTAQGGTGGTRDNYLTDCKHLYYKELSNPNAKVKVVAEDQFGNKYESERIMGSKEYDSAVAKTY